jgi:hypothetical protein
VEVNYRGLLHFRDDPLSPPYPNVYWPDASAGSVRVIYAATAGAKTDRRWIPERQRRGVVAKAEQLIERFGLPAIFLPFHGGEGATEETIPADANRVLSGEWPSETVAREIRDERRIARDFLREAFGERAASSAARQESVS